MRCYFYLIILYICLYNDVCVTCYKVPIPDKIVIIGDSNVINFVRNFYNEIITVYNVPNFKIVVWNPSSYEVYEKYGIPVEYSPIGLSDEVASTFQFSQGFTKKINDRFKILLEYLKQNLTILSLDADLYFYENPLNLLNYISPNDDITYVTDFVDGNHTEINVGLMYIKPTLESIKLFEKILKIVKISQSDFEFTEQGITNLVISSKRIKNLKYGVIDMMVFVNGYIFFDQIKIFVDQKSDIKTIGFHNNCINGGMAKIYKFKELGLWKIDDDEYYSLKTRKYIRYSAIIDSNIGIPKSMLYLMYLGKELNRTIIFPRFIFEVNNVTYITSFVYLWNVAYFEKTYGRNYRENISFLIIINNCLNYFLNI